MLHQSPTFLPQDDDIFQKYVQVEKSCSVPDLIDTDTMQYVRYTLLAAFSAIHFTAACQWHRYMESTVRCYLVFNWICFTLATFMHPLFQDELYKNQQIVLSSDQNAVTSEQIVQKTSQKDYILLKYAIEVPLILVTLSFGMLLFKFKRVENVIKQQEYELPIEVVIKQLDK